VKGSGGRFLAVVVVMAELVVVVAVAGVVVVVIGVGAGVSGPFGAGGPEGVPGTVVIVAPPVAPAVVVVVVGPVAQPALVMVLVSKVTAPLRANRRPCTVAAVVAVMDVVARTVPMSADRVPKVAELPTCQNTLQAWIPLRTATLLLEAVMSVDGDWKMNTAFGSPLVSRVRVPVIPSVAPL
jgi:hypothetical protein